MPPNPALLKAVKEQAEAERKRQEAHDTQVKESDRYTLEYPSEGYRDGRGKTKRRYGKTKRRYGKTKKRYGKTKRTRKTR